MLHVMQLSFNQSGCIFIKQCIYANPKCVSDIDSFGCDPMGTMFSTYWYLTQSKKFCSCRFNNFAKYLLSNTLQKLLNSFKFCQTGAISQNLVTLIILIIIQKLGHVENRDREVKDENLFKKRFGKTGFDGSCKSEISRKKRKKEKKFFSAEERKKERKSFNFISIVSNGNLTWSSSRNNRLKTKQETAACPPSLGTEETLQERKRERERESKNENS